VWAEAFVGAVGISPLPCVSRIAGRVGPFAEAAFALCAIRAGKGGITVVSRLERGDVPSLLFSDDAGASSDGVVDVKSLRLEVQRARRCGSSSIAARNRELHHVDPSRYLREAFARRPLGSAVSLAARRRPLCSAIAENASPRTRWVPARFTTAGRD